MSNSLDVYKLHSGETVAALPDDCRLSPRWINQPSKLQPAHEWNGCRVLAVSHPTADLLQVYFVDGKRAGDWAVVPRLSLSKGWPNK